MDKELQSFKPLESVYDLVVMFKVASQIQLNIGRDYPELFADPILNKKYQDLQNLKEQKTKEALYKTLDQPKGDNILERDQSYPDQSREIASIKPKKLQKGRKKIHDLLDYIELFWTASATGDKLRLLQHISQRIEIADDKSIEDLAKQMLPHQDPRFRGEICYLLGQTGRIKYLSWIRNLLNDPDPWVQKQALEAEKKLNTLVLDETARQILKSLFAIIEDTRERFYNEHYRYQLLARIRKILREQLYNQFPEGSPGKSLIVAIINATYRTTAKRFRIHYLDIFKESLEALSKGVDKDTMLYMEKRLLEIDDELQTEAVS